MPPLSGRVHKRLKKTAMGTRALSAIGEWIDSNGLAWPAGQLPITAALVETYRQD
jgi:hypothetical protein